MFQGEKLGPRVANLSGDTISRSKGQGQGHANLKLNMVVEQ